MKLEIYNINSQKVTTLLNKELPAGAHTVSWDGTDYASGLYFYKMSVGDFEVSKKMVLLK